MKKLSIEQKLDFVLELIKENEPKHNIVQQGKFQRVEETPAKSTYGHLVTNKKLIESGIVSSEVIKILDRLISDKNITLITTLNTSFKYYSTTIDGLLFIGYENKKTLDNEAIISLQNSESQARTYANRLLWATWCAGIGAVALLLWQIFVWINPTYADFPYIIFGIIRKLRP